MFNGLDRRGTENLFQLHCSETSPVDRRVLSIPYKLQSLFPYIVLSSVDHHSASQKLSSAFQNTNYLDWLFLLSTIYADIFNLLAGKNLSHSPTVLLIVSQLSSSEMRVDSRAQLLSCGQPGCQF